jgi:hypothetical protein
MTPLDNTPVCDVPQRHYFSMGDNRDNSQDSRALSPVGYIPTKKMVGRVEFIFFSTDGSAQLWEGSGPSQSALGASSRECIRSVSPLRPNVRP